MQVRAGPRRPEDPLGVETHGEHGFGFAEPLAGPVPDGKGFSPHSATTTPT